MLFRALSRRSLWLFACLSVASGFAQSPHITTLFDETPGRARSAGKHKKVTLNRAASSALGKTPAKFSIGNFPLADGSQADFDMEPARLFGPESRITMIGDGGTTSSVPLPDARVWYGRDTSGKSRSLVLISKSDGSIGAMVTGDTSTSDTVVIPDATGDEYAIAAAEVPARDLCSVGELVPSDSITGPTGTTSSDGIHSTRLGTGTRQVDIMLDLSYSAYQRLGTTAKANDYITQLMGAVGSIYRRDLDVELRVSQLYIWNTADTFSANKGADGILDTGDQLNAYQSYVNANRASDNRDLAHLLSYNTGLGGIAYVDVLCNKDYAVGVSNIYAALNFPGDLNTYYWDTMVVSHEMGHNFGSPHTHCFTPPIDCCATQQNCSGCTTAAPAAGTIMSYCHLQFGKGGSVVMKFHERCVELMRSRVDNAACLTPFYSEPRAAVASYTGLVEIAPGDMDPSRADTTDFGTVDPGSARVTSTFYLYNPGSKTLQITSPVTITGSRQLSLTATPPASTVEPGGATFFSVTFNPAVEGQHDAVVSFSSNDPQRPKFSFAIRGTSAVQTGPISFLYNGTTNIPDGSATGVAIPITVSGVTGKITDVDFAIEGTACTDAQSVGLQHGYVGDLKLVLESPSGRRVILMNRPGGGTYGANGKNFCNTVLDDDGGGSSIQAITGSGTPYSGRFTPAEPLSAFDGESPNGTWKLYAYDMVAPDAGVLRAASLRITGSQAITTSAVNDWQQY